MYWFCHTSIWIRHRYTSLSSSETGVYPKVLFINLEEEVFLWNLVSAWQYFEIVTRIMPDNILPKHIKILGTPYSFSRISVLVTFTMRCNLRLITWQHFPCNSEYKMKQISVISLFGMFQGPSEVSFIKVCQQMTKRFRTLSEIVVKQWLFTYPKSL